MKRLSNGKRRVSRRQSMQVDFLLDRQPDAVVMPREPGGPPPRHLWRADGCICELQETPGLFVRLSAECPVHRSEVTPPEGRERGPRAEPGEHLATALAAAVPLWIMDMRRLPAHLRIQTAHGLAQVVAERSDILMFGGGKKGDVAEVFNALARGLAALSFQPGGVRFAGHHWETVDAT